MHSKCLSVAVAAAAALMVCVPVWSQYSASVKVYP